MHNNANVPSFTSKIKKLYINSIVQYLSTYIDYVSRYKINKYFNVLKMFLYTHKYVYLQRNVIRSPSMSLFNPFYTENLPIPSAEQQIRKKAYETKQKKNYNMESHFIAYIST